MERSVSWDHEMDFHEVQTRSARGDADETFTPRSRLSESHLTSRPQRAKLEGADMISHSC